MFKVIWDKNNTVRLTMSSAGDALNEPPRPVFFEELDLLGMDDKGWVYPSSPDPLLWACNRRYFYNGQLVMEVKGGNIFDAPTIQIVPGFENLTLVPANMEYLRKRNEDSLFLIEHEAMDFINETFRRYKGLADVTKKNPDIDFQELAARMEKKTKEEHVVVKESCDSFDVMPLSEAEAQGKAPILSSKVDMFISSFSGGKDSQVVLDLVSRVVPSTDFLVIYSDTGYELPTSLQLYKDIEDYYHERYPDLKFYLAKNHQPVLYYWDEIGSPSNVHRWCCGVMKTAPLYRKLKDISGLGKQPHVVSYLGTRAEESARRSTYARVAKDAKHTNVINVSPILAWNTTEIWLYLLMHCIPFNQAYRKGLGRVGCISCPFGSDWNDYLCNRLFPQTSEPFVEKIRSFVARGGVKDIDDYIKTGNWKIKAGGSGYETESHFSVVSQSPDFKALISKPKESIFEWLKTLGPYTSSQNGENYSVDLKYRDTIYRIKLSFDGKKDTILVEIPNVGSDILFISHLKRVLNKTTYCVHCEMCEVECPTGALSVVPRVRVDNSKCVKCHRCLDFKDNGCTAANSIKKSEGIKLESQKNMKTTINRYNNFGFREKWLSYFFSHIDTFFDNEDHGLNVANQLPPFTNWLRDSEILKQTSREVTEGGRLLSKLYSVDSKRAWEYIWINLVHNSEICAWYSRYAEFNRSYLKDELEKLLEETLPQYSESVRKNAFGSFQNTLVSSSLGSDLFVGVVSKENGKPYFKRLPYNNLSIGAIAYSLYKYAEKHDRRSLTVSEFYNPEQTEGVVREFGIDRATFERDLRSLQDNVNKVLTVELNMGLDNINLRDDLSAFEVFKLFLQ